MRKGAERIKRAERILGDSSFVMEVLKASEVNFERKYQLRAQGCDIEHLARRVPGLFDMIPEAIYSPGKYKEKLRARSVLYYWAVRELGITQPAVSLAVKRGDKLVMEMGHEGWESKFII